jgi:hypothetical protein
MTFNPSLPQSKFKASLYAKHPKIVVSELTPQQLQTLTNNRSVVKWAEQEGFLEWLGEKDTVRRLLEATSESAVACLMSIVTETDVGPAGRVTAANQVAAARLILEYAGFTPPSHKVVEYRDKDIEKMTETELKDFIATNLKLVKPSA